MRLSKKVADIAASIGKKLYFVLNKTTQDNEAIMQQQVSANGDILAVLPMDARMQKAGLLGQELEAKGTQAAAMADTLLA